NLSHANLTKVDLSYANLFAATLQGADVTDADLTHAFRQPGVIRADLEGAKGVDRAKGLKD
ncbi:MAG TPA: pentapeptide repeat-containing protein, partial [Chloroflexi bacterium]|nr:pentapeptide repeat-containing protein [Chloroflexota bacterium]